MAPLDDTLGVPPVAPLRSFDDYGAARKSIFDNVLTAFGTKYPISNPRYSLGVENLRYDSDKPFTISDQKKAIMSGASLDRKLMGDWVLKDTAGKELDRKKATTIAHVPYMTDRGTFINNGSEYSISHQLRLKPGVYTRRRESGELEAHFNVKPGTGRSFRIYMEPSTGVFRLGVGQSTLKLYPLLRAMGLQDRDISKSWGNEILAANVEASDNRAVSRAAAQFLDTRTAKTDTEVSEVSKEATGDIDGLRLRDAFDKYELDPDVTTSTLGKAFKTAGPDSIMHATGKLLNLSRNQGETDDRDSLEYQTFHSPEDFFAERITKDAGQIGRKLLWKATLHGNLSKIPHAALTKQMRSVIASSGLAQGLEEPNLLEPYDQAHRVIRLGEGGISSVDAIPDESRNVNPSQFGIIDFIRTPESSKAGIDTRLTHGTYKGPNNTVMFKVMNARTGKEEFLTAQQAAKVNIAFPGEMDGDSKNVRAMSRSKKLSYVPRSEVDYVLPSALQMFTASSSVTPMIGGIKGGRLSMGARFANQALPLRDAEAPFIRSDADDLGARMGAVKASGAGLVSSITKDGVTVRGVDGTTQNYELYDNFPLNRKTFLHNDLQVKVGDQVLPGQVIAKSNYTDSKGDMALGKNLNVAYLPWRGLAFEDAIIVSESAAKKLSSEHMYQNVFEPESSDRADRRAYLSVFPVKYKDAQLRTLNDKGVVKPGTKIKYGDPLILAVRKASQDAVHRGKQPLFSDVSLTWKHENDGLVTDVSPTKDGGWNVTVKSYAPLKEADKIAGRFGEKGVVSKIIPDSQMPHTSDGNPVEVILNPLGIVSRVNPSQVYEALLGKIVSKTGQPYRLPHFSKTALPDFVKAELQKNGISDTEDLVNPENGSKIPKVLAGSRYFYKLQHTVESKGKARDVAAYTIDDIPASGSDSGSKRIAAMECGALLSHGATAVLRDAKTIRGQRNDEYWRYFRTGLTPPPPRVPMIYKKFMAQLQSAGVNIQKKGEKLHLFAMTASQVDDLAKNEITVPETVQGDDLEPIEGGLFDPKLTGGHGGCFHGSTAVFTDKGMLRIDDIVKNRLEVRVWSYNFSSKSFELKPVTNWFTNHTDSVIRTLIQNKIHGKLAISQHQFNPSIIWSTAEHQVYTEDGEKRDISTADYLLSIEEGLSYSQSQILYGSLLGDAGLNPVNKVYCERHAMGQVEYLRFKKNVFLPLVRRWSVDVFKGLERQRQAELVLKAHAAMHQADQLIYKNRIKTISQEWLNKIDELGLMCWFMDDGHVHRDKRKNTLYISMATCCFNKSDIKLLQDWMLSRWNIRSCVTRNNKKYGDRNMGWCVCFSGSQAEMFLEIVAPYMDPAWAKLPVEPHAVPCKICGKKISPQREFCDACLISKARAAGSRKIDKSIRRRIGTSSTIRRILAGDASHENTDTVYRARYDHILKILGTRVPSCLEDTEHSFTLKRIACNHEHSGKQRYYGTKTVYDIEVADNHNYFANGVLVSNSKWGYIRLSEPMPNPVMEDPIRNILGLTRKKYEALLSGAEPLNGERGGAGVKNLLAKINVPAKIQELEATIRNGAKSKRDAAVKALGYLKSMQKEGIHPADFIVDKVPVLPPVFRPIVKLDKMMLNADPNFLYKDLMHVNSVLGKISPELPVDKTADERLRVYHAYKAISGLGDPVNAKTLEKNVKGVLGHIFGSGGPKTGTFQRRVIGMPVDVVGRSTVTPNPDLSMDQVGIPEDLAWTVYRPFIVRRLVRNGLPATEAARAVADKQAVAKSAMIDEMGQRPVLINRAPTLHKFNLMAFKPVLAAGKTIQVSPVVTKGFTMDFDGDAVNFHLPVSDEAVREANEKMLPSRNLFSPRDFKVHYLPSQEFTLGLYLGSKKSSKPKRYFATKADAVKAFRRGELRADDPIEIK